MFKYGFESLDVWKLSRKLNKSIYKLTLTFPTEEKYGLCSQMRRCATSVCSNIAEGSGRKYPKDRVRFLHISRGSLMELLTQVLLASDLEYLENETEKELRLLINEISNKLNGLERNWIKQSPNSK